jgi:hypothetical protein
MIAERILFYFVALCMTNRTIVVDICLALMLLCVFYYMVQAFCDKIKLNSYNNFKMLGAMANNGKVAIERRAFMLHTMDEREKQEEGAA